MAESLFGDAGKEEGALRTIGEVSAMLGVRPHVLRYWEDQFAELKPLKRAGGRRLYRAADVALAARIDRLVNHEGYTLRGARVALSMAPAPASADMATKRGMAELRPRLIAIRDSLAAALADEDA
ncbi:MerR family transcriptional regulator [Qipengyuania sediminis]|uniref:MerR family transcriptional regulator n=1 Tax=Qipengyuania sediminis TaxID=1532023 RepID=UPI001F112CC3|nr:MerR family transcriptional regulator [Qipengyuania sediminis]